MERFKTIKKQDPELWQLVASERKRQAETIDLIPSENFVSPAILELLGSELTNKYSEGYPGKRYYPGNIYFDAIERLAQTRALKAFRLSARSWSVNVQPYSGSPANIEIYSSLMNIGDTFLGMSLASGGHLTHGHKVSFSGKAWKAIQYGVDPSTGLIDYNEVERLAKKHRPKVIVSGITAYPRKIDFKRFGAIAKKVGAYHVADISHISGLIMAGLHPSPFPYADIIMTTTHKSLRGPRGAVIFSRNTFAEKIDRAVFPGMQGGPHNNVTAGIAAMFGEAMKPSFKIYQRQIVKNARALAEALKKYGFKLVTGGTENHMLLVDVRPFGLDGMEAQNRLERVGIIANRNSIPGDISPFKPSGLRMGTPAVTTRGMKEGDMRLIAGFIRDTLAGKKSPKDISHSVQRLARKGGQQDALPGY
jgi:glycine hydroxymethyltransferase